MVENKLSLGEGILQVSQQLCAIIADKDGDDTAHALGDHDGPERGVAVAETQGFRTGCATDPQRLRLVVTILSWPRMQRKIVPIDTDVHLRAHDHAEPQ